MSKTVRNRALGAMTALVLALGPSGCNAMGTRLSGRGHRLARDGASKLGARYRPSDEGVIYAFDLIREGHVATGVLVGIPTLPFAFAGMLIASPIALVDTVRPGDPSEDLGIGALCAQVITMPVTVPVALPLAVLGMAIDGIVDALTKAFRGVAEEHLAPAPAPSDLAAVTSAERS
jgi:hypothetical protein